jgi:hypothetical protein
MKFHLTLEQCYDAYLERSGKKPSLEIYESFAEGWYDCAREINEGEDSDWFQERLYEEGFLVKEVEGEE